MKNSIIIILSAFIFSVFTSCEERELVQISPNPVPPTVTQPTNGAIYNFTAAEGSQDFNIKWENADYGFNAIYTYTVQIDKQGNNFAKPVKLGTAEVDSFLYSVDRFNAAVKKLKYAVGDEASLELRVTSYVSPVVEDLISSANAIKFKVY